MIRRPTVSIGELERRGALLEIQDGNHGDKHPVARDYVSDGVPFLMASDIRDGIVDLKTCKFITREQADSLRIGFARSGDVLLTHKGTVGNVAILPEIEDYVMLTPQVTYYRVNPQKLSNRYLRFAFCDPGFQDRLVSRSAQSTRPYIGITAQRDLEILWCDRREQEQIALILSAYGDLIENNTRRIEILEDMTKMIYREWFVNFRFPGHEKVEMVESRTGRMPQGWNVRSLGQLLTLDKGVSYSGAGLTEDGIPMVNLKNIRAGGGFRRDATKPYSGKFASRHTVKAGDVVLANTDLTQAGNVIASPALIPPLSNGTPILISHHLYVARCVLDTPSLFFYHLMLDESFRGFAKGFAVGTTVLGLPREAILNFAFPCPPDSLIKSFATQVSPLHGLIETLYQQSDNLGRTRDLLLAKLVSGEVSVGKFEAEAIARSV